MGFESDEEERIPAENRANYFHGNNSGWTRQFGLRLEAGGELSTNFEEDNRF